MGTLIGKEREEDLPRVSHWKFKEKQGISDKFNSRGYTRVPLSIEAKAYGGEGYGGITDSETYYVYKDSIVTPLINSREHSYTKETLYLTNGKTLRISSELILLIQSIEKSKYILDLKDNWDDEGAKAYLEDTWIKAIRFIVNYAELILANTGKSIIAPDIYHGPDGSIDLLWKHLSFNLLINIPKDNMLLGTFYGDDYSSQKIEGSFNPELVKASLFPMLVNLS